MATPEDDFVDALSELSELTKAAKAERSEAADLSTSALGHLDIWTEIFLKNEAALSPSDVREFAARVDDARRHAASSHEDFDDAVIDALQTSLRLFRSLPGTTTIDPPMPKPRRGKVKERAFAE